MLRVRVINQNNYAAPLRPPMECAFSALTLLVGWQEGIQLVKTEWWGAGMVICLERGADLHMAQPGSPRTTRLSRYQKDKTNLDFTEARDIQPQHQSTEGTFH